MERHIFRVVLEEERDGGYSIYVPALPGCASQGETREEALANIREAIELYLWSLKDDVIVFQGEIYGSLSHCLLNRQFLNPANF
ncbi:type II toxin-antitoxin system HicB family antitoxin [Candidatus Hakubella thermalkaliphila]|uniref:HicB-like antitoxin of toxin-antitoxin system domain-containing protein n=1 Tax=Candidatus Hakubella thermalkaliphila TaxID=2754717 RepID=A0A6V8Q599_9ACTN|nr:type II toxin-antitoxin system HicB family antitoxin [Candidatus Hakubella thermalkaliphila]GFP39777.1 hypothetical protein HKBW3S47_01475 [Candidatus Hakubella thermalkaliphila]